MINPSARLRVYTVRVVALAAMDSIPNGFECVHLKVPIENLGILPIPCDDLLQAQNSISASRHNGTYTLPSQDDAFNG
jgi:hypothetical protein